MGLRIETLDPGVVGQRLVFTYINNPATTDFVGNVAPDREFKQTATVRVFNDGSVPLSITEIELSGPYDIVTPASELNAPIAAGSFRDIVVTFDPSEYKKPKTDIDFTSTYIEGGLIIRTDDGQQPEFKVVLDGFWQRLNEAGQEPNINEIWKIFGYGNTIDGLSTLVNGGRSVLANGAVYAQVDETEVLSAYWKIADGASSARLTQISALHGPTGEVVSLQAPGDINDTIRLWRVSDLETNTLLPNRVNGQPATTEFTRGTIPDSWFGDDVFGLKLRDVSSDSRLNALSTRLVDTDGVFYSQTSETTARRVSDRKLFNIADLDLVDQGQWIRFFQAVDADGNEIPNTYLGIFDFPNGNDDFNDIMFVLEGVEPVGFIDRAPQLVLDGLEPAAPDDRVVFSSVTNPNTAPEVQALGGQVFRDLVTLDLRNDGVGPLTVTSAKITGPQAAAFEVVSFPKTVAAGQTGEVVLRFLGQDTTRNNVAERFEATLTIITDSTTGGTRTIALAGLAQNQSELQQEPTVADVVWAFGFGTDVAQDLLKNGGRVEAVGDEVLSPYFQRLDASSPVEVIQLASYLRQNDVARLGVHGLDSAETTFLFAQDDQEGQTLSPNGLVAGPGNSGSLARGMFSNNDPFGVRIVVDDKPTFAAWSDPVANRTDPDLEGLVESDRGHLIRYFVAKDADGSVIPGTYIGIQDYPGASNFDYQDHMFLIRNVRPYALTQADDVNGNGVNDALERDADNNGVVDFFDFGGPEEPDQVAFNGSAWTVDDVSGVTLIANEFDEGGQGVAYNDLTPEKLGHSDTLGVRPETSVDISQGEFAVGFIQAGEWLEFTIDVEEAGIYDLSMFASSRFGKRQVETSFSKNGMVYETAVSDVKRGQNSNDFKWTDDEAVSLQEGLQVMRVTFLVDDMDLWKIDLDPVTLFV